MRTVPLGTNAAIYPVPSDRPWVAAAIGPRSKCDAVEISGLGVLRAGMVLPVPASFTVAPFRSIRTGEGQTQADEVNTIELLLWERGEEHLIRPFPRGPVRVAYAATVTDVAAAARRLRLPFQGRRMAQLRIQVESAPGDVSVAWAVYGIGYRPREAITPGTWSQRHGVVSLGSDTIIVEDQGPSGDTLATFTYTGGTDHAERFDELEVWLTIGTADDQSIVAEIEAWGENGVPG